MHAYRDQYATLFKDGRNVVLIAISTDPVDTLAAGAHDDQFLFLLASDADRAVGKAYGALASRRSARSPWRSRRPSRRAAVAPPRPDGPRSPTR